MDFNRWIPLMKRCDHFGYHILCDGRARTYSELAGNGVLQFPYLKIELTVLPVDQLKRVVYFLSCPRQVNLVAFTFEKVGVIPLFQLFDVPCYRRLTDVQLIGCFRETEIFYH